MPARNRYRRLARKVESDPDFLAAALARDRARRGITFAAQAAELGITAEQLSLLGLCGQPGGPPLNAASLDRIAAKFGVDRGVLGRMAGACTCTGDGDDQPGGGT